MTELADIQLYSVQEAAKLFAVSERTIQHWIHTGKLRAYKVGGKVFRIKHEDLMKMMEPTFVEADGSELVVMDAPQTERLF